MRVVFCFLMVLSSYVLGEAAILTVGPGKTFRTPCSAFSAAKAGDTVEIDGKGYYRGDVCYIPVSNLTILGVNGRPKIDGAHTVTAGHKALWVIQGDNTIVNNIEFTGAAVPDLNGAGIRLEGRNLTVRNSYFHDNQDGILTQVGNSGNILIEFSEFSHNGAGDGKSHNIYVNAADSFTLRYSTSHDSIVGHLVKSRATVTNILYDFLYDGLNGTGSYEVDLPNAGTAYLIGNVIAQGLKSQNNNIISYGEEGPGINQTQRLYVVNNTIVNRKTKGTFLNIASWIGTPAQVMNNIFAGAGTLVTQRSAVMTTNLSGENAQFVNSAYGDFTLQPTSPAINRGTDPSRLLMPLWSNQARTCGKTREMIGQIDIGAYEYGSHALQVICSVPLGQVQDLAQ